MTSEDSVELRNVKSVQGGGTYDNAAFDNNNPSSVVIHDKSSFSASANISSPSPSVTVDLYTDIAPKIYQSKDVGAGDNGFVANGSEPSSYKSDSDSATASDHSKFLQRFENCQEEASKFFSSHWQTIKISVLVVMVMAYAAYFAYALYYEFSTEPSIRLMWVTMAVVVGFAICIVQDHWGDVIYHVVAKPVIEFVNSHWKLCKWTFILLVTAGYLTFIIVDVALNNPYNLVSWAGLAVFVLLMYLYSANRRKIRWRPVIWGLGLQFVFALLVLRTTAGLEAFKWLGDRVQEFMAYSDEGAIFVFGETYTDHMFAMKVLPVIIFFSSVISVLYYLGVMQAVILKIAWVMQVTLGTTAGESVNAAGNIFLGQTEAPLLIRPLIKGMSTSELHAVIVGGFATIAGAVMATYIIFGVPANHLISASIMAAPCALALSKLTFPETNEAKLKEKGSDVKMEPSGDKNVVEAAATGAINAVSLCANIAANLIAFIAILAFVNATLTWFGQRAGMYQPELTFEFLCSYVLWPLPFLMGADSSDCGKIAELIGVKIFMNEFIAYTTLGEIIQNKETLDAYVTQYGGNYTHINDDIYLPITDTLLVGGIMQDRSIVIATYALCGFANLSSIGIVIGGLSAMVPERKSEIAYLAARGLIVGNVVSFMNACTAGLTYQGS